MCVLISHVKLISHLINQNGLKHISGVANTTKFQKINVNTVTQGSQDDGPYHADFSLCPSWNVDNENIIKIKRDLLNGMSVIPNFVSEEEEEILYNEMQIYLKKMRYEFDCWDNAIHGFRETEKSAWKDPRVTEIVERAKRECITPPEVPLPHTHILDLDSKGHIKPHVDSVRFCGTTVAGICLLSPAVMRLRNCKQTDLFADFLLSRRCFYIMKDAARYDYTHEVLPQESSIFKGEPIVRTRRISVITRSAANS